MSAQHTPGPWEARASKACDDFGIIAQDASAEGGWVCVAECFSDIRRPNELALEEAAANARRIVLCFNAHDELLEALKDLRLRYAALFNLYAKLSYPGDASSDLLVALTTADNAVAKATAAVDAAERGKVMTNRATSADRSEGGA